MKVFPGVCILPLFLLVSVFTGECHSQVFNHCPDWWIISPCTCFYDGELNIGLMDCTKVVSEQQLSDIFHNTEDFPAEEFKELTIFFNPEIKVLNADIFGPCSFQEFTVSGGVLERVEEGALAKSSKIITMMDLRRNNIISLEDLPFSEIANFKKLTHLYLSENNFPSWPEALMSDSITYLDMSQNPLTVLPADAFSHLPKLEELYLRDVKLSSIDAGIFVGLENLNHLDVSHNQLSVLSADSFSTGSLQHLAIYFVFNAIQTVEPDSFTYGGLIDIYGNQVTALEEEVWRPHLEAGGVLSAGGNPLSCTCPLAWLIRSPELMNIAHVDYLATCTDGRYLYDLTEDDFIDCL